MSAKRSQVKQFKFLIIIVICVVAILGIVGNNHYQQLRIEKAINKAKMENANADKTLTIFLQESVTEEQAQQLAATLRTIPDVSRVEYISREKAMEIYAEENKNDQELVDMVRKENVLEASIDVYSKSDTAIANAEAYANTQKPTIARDVVKGINAK